MRLSLPTTKAANAAGLGAVYQDAELAWNMSVAENLLLGEEGRWINHAKLQSKARDILTRIGLDIDPAARAGSLSAAEMQMLTLATLFHRKFKLIILDEPTARLSGRESELLFDLIRRFKAEGLTIVYISHRLAEVKRLCDRATILRDGRLVARVTLSETPVEAVIERMVGRELAHASHHSHASDRVVLQARGLSRGKAVLDASLTLHAGEVLCIAGLVGSGRTELLRLLAGVDAADAGEVLVDGKAVAGSNPRRRIRAGLGLLPEERKRDGIIRHRPVSTNIALPAMKRFSRFGIIRRAHLKSRAEALMRDVQLRPLDVDRPIGNFSGGNQQKAIIGRWLAADTRIFLDRKSVV
mgnify:CR=1 FL=1